MARQARALIATARARRHGRYRWLALGLLILDVADGG